MWFHPFDFFTGSDSSAHMEEDRVKALADAEQKNLWEATEVIDMDKV